MVATADEYINEINLLVMNFLRLTLKSSESCLCVIWKDIHAIRMETASMNESKSLSNIFFTEAFS